MRERESDDQRHQPDQRIRDRERDEEIDEAADARRQNPATQIVGGSGSDERIRGRRLVELLLQVLLRRRCGRPITTRHEDRRLLVHGIRLLYHAANKRSPETIAIARSRPGGSDRPACMRSTPREGQRDLVRRESAFGADGHRDVTPGAGERLSARRQDGAVRGRDRAQRGGEAPGGAIRGRRRDPIACGSAAIRSQRVTRPAARSSPSRTTARSLRRRGSRPPPSSVAFCTTRSIFSPLSRATTRITRPAGRAGDWLGDLEPQAVGAELADDRPRLAPCAVEEDALGPSGRRSTRPR